VTLATLGSEIVQPWTDYTRSNLILTFDRVPLPPGARLSDLAEYPAIGALFQSHTLVAGPRLFYVDDGAVTIEQGGEQVPLSSGEDLLLPADVLFDARNAAEQCSTLFILTVNRPAEAGGYSSKVTGPRFSSAEACPPPARLLEWTTKAVLAPAAQELFIARMTFDPSGYTYDTGEGVGLIHHPGPVALMVEKGTLAVAEGREASEALYAPGSTVTFDDHTPYIAEYYPLGNDPGNIGTAILAGAIPPESTLAEPGDAYRSPAGGFAIAWGPWWMPASRSWVDSPPSYRLELTNYSSSVTFEDIAYYEGGVAQCVADGVAALLNDPTLTVTQQSEDPVVAIPVDRPARAVASVTYSGTNVLGEPADFVRQIECLSLAFEESVLRIDIKLPLAELETQAQEVAVVLESLVIQV
jgi:hypothetical protein